MIKPKSRKHEDRIKALEDRAATLTAAMIEVGNIAEHVCKMSGGEVIYRDGKVVAFQFPPINQKPANKWLRWWPF